MLEIRGCLALDSRFTITSEDGFFITFLAAWSSVRQELWTKSPENMVILILGIFCYAALISQVRLFLEPIENLSKENRRIIKVLSLIALFALSIIVLYFCWKQPMFLLESDKYIIIASAVMWGLLPIINLINEKYIVKIEKDSKLSV